VAARNQVAAEGGEQLQRLLVLDPFGDELQPEVVGQLDGGTDDRGGVGVADHVEHEGLVELTSSTGSRFR
jgi:hypothetical protein